MRLSSQVVRLLSEIFVHFLGTLHLLPFHQVTVKARCYDLLLKKYSGQLYSSSEEYAPKVKFAIITFNF